MSIKKIRRTRPTKQSLSQGVEKISYEVPDSPLFDVQDEDVLGYVDQFLRGYSNIPPLEKFSLLTKEDALKALVVLEKAHSLVQSHLKTAKALKKMLNTQSTTSDESH